MGRQLPARRPSRDSHSKSGLRTSMLGRGHHARPIVTPIVEIRAVEHHVHAQLFGHSVNCV